jgi:beta-ureidopropionase / N-carbamoyl-L-amino-acid hydrolase
VGTPAPSTGPRLDRLQADLDRIAEFRDPEAPGWTRRVFTPFDQQCREWVAQQMAAAGLEVRKDAAGNVIGTRKGRAQAPAVVSGSHTDTVQGGGRFDGIIGVLGAIEVARCLEDSRAELPRDFVVVDFLGEEPNDFGLSCVGSRAIAGSLDAGHLELKNASGATLADALATAGGDPGHIESARWGRESVHSFVELHIEQGPVLEQSGVPIGVVSGIVGIRRLLATFEGRPDHAGTTPMRLRHDALCGASEAILAIERLAGGTGVAEGQPSDSGGVATTGRIEVQPGALNVVPSESQLWAEVRSQDEAWLDDFADKLDATVAGTARRRGLEMALRWLSRERPVLTSQSVSDLIKDAAKSLGFEPMRISSGAGHDAAQMARLSPVGMIFVPSRDGRSHCPEEWTDIEQIGKGVAVLAETIVRLCAQPDLSGSTL